jgi:hypothetical protein
VEAGDVERVEAAAAAQVEEAAFQRSQLLDLERQQLRAPGPETIDVVRHARRVRAWTFL